MDFYFYFQKSIKPSFLGIKVIEEKYVYVFRCYTRYDQKLKLFGHSL